MKASEAWLLAVVIAGLLLRLTLWCCQANPAGDDGERYYAESRNLVEHGVFSTAGEGESVAPDAHDLPLWPGTMAALLWATGSKAITVRLAGLLNIALMAGAVAFLVTLLGRKPFECGTTGKALGAAVLLFMPESVPYSLFHMPDAMALCFLCGALAFYFRGVYGTRRWLLGAALLFALAILSKPICLPMAGAFLAMLLVVLPSSLPRRVGWMAACAAIVALSLTPWVIRNKVAFGTAGLTTISGTNLYGCNWGWMVKQWPETKRTEALRQNVEIEAQTEGLDKMARSKALGAYARDQLIGHLGDYLWFTVCRHPRLYVGTGTIALLRYLGADGACAALGAEHISPTVKVTPGDKAVAWLVQGGSLLLLLALYLTMAAGAFLGLRRAMRSGRWLSTETVAWGCAIGGVLLLAVVIGPVTATRYRFVMLPFFALLAALCAKPRSAPTTSRIGG